MRVKIVEKLKVGIEWFDASIYYWCYSKDHRRVSKYHQHW